MQDTFDIWYRGVSVSRASAIDTGSLDHWFRGNSVLPVLKAGRAFIGVSSGGVRTGGVADSWKASQPLSTGGVTTGGTGVLAGLNFHIYTNNGQGGTIDYSVPIATVVGTSWTSSALACSSRYKFGVRAFDPISGLEERNVDAVVELVLDDSYNDLTLVPSPPLGLRAFPLSGGRIRVEWGYPAVERARRPDEFRVYLGPRDSIDYSASAADVPWPNGVGGQYSAELSGLTDGVEYSVGVRARNAIGEERNRISVVVSADTTPPAAVDFLSASAVQEM